MTPSPVRALLAATLAAAPSAPLDVEVIRPEAAPVILLHRQAGPLVALRLSSAVDPALPEGGVELLQELVRPALREEAARLGARLELRHEGGYGVVAITGPVPAFDALASVLRRAAADPPLDIATLRQARARAASRVLGRLEQPGPRVARALRAGLIGSAMPAGPEVARLGPDDVRDMRVLLYGPDVTRVVVVGNVEPGRVRAAFGGWPAAPGPTAAPPRPDTIPDRARPQTHREWGGLALRADASTATLETAAELVRRRLARAPLRDATADVWRVAGTPALVVMGAAADSSDVRAVLERAVEEAAARVDPTATLEARRRVRNRILLDARTAAGRAEVIGRLADGEDRPAGAGAFMEELEGVREHDVVGALRAALRSTPVFVEASP
jgi:predicted Zn-dependent peptidase